MNTNAVLRGVILSKYPPRWKGRVTFATQVNLDLKQDTHTEDSRKLNEESWANAKPFGNIPGPSKLSLLTSYMPSGKYHNKSFIDVFTMAKRQYGDIFILPGLFGKFDTLFTFNPEDFQNVYRADGQWPHRPGFDIMDYYRKELRPDYYKKTCGLGTEQGEDWGKLRSTVNPILMQPQTMKAYIPAIDNIATEFVERIRAMRNPNTNEVPATFKEEIQYLAIENTIFMSLDIRLGLLSGQPSEDAKQFARTITEFFELLFELHVKPSVWKFIATPKYKKIIQAQDRIYEFCKRNVKVAMSRIKEGNSKTEKSILERLLQIDQDIATTMAFDITGAGTDSTTSAFIACLFNIAKNPEKQNILREELRNILPHKDTPLTKENMQNLPYLRGCIKESLRLNPVTSMNFRKTGRDLVLSGYQVPKGTAVAMVSHLLQLDDSQFPKASKFIPERWLRNQPKVTECPSARTANPFIYLPFGFGPRVCIGKRFVDLELDVALARLIRNFYVEYHHADFITKTTIINYMEGDFRFKFADVPE